MIDLDEFALCTHEEADMMIFVHTNHATKGGSPEWVLMAKASDTEIIFIAVSMMSALRETGLHQTCELHVAKPTLEMDSCPWTVRLHWATEEQGHSPITGFDVVSTFCDEITDFSHKFSQLPWTVIDDDMEILCRFVSECMTILAQLRASMMQD